MNFSGKTTQTWLTAIALFCAGSLAQATSQGECDGALRSPIPQRLEAKLARAYQIWARILPKREAQLALDYQRAIVRHILVLKDMDELNDLTLMEEISAEAWRKDFEEQAAWMEEQVRKRGDLKNHYRRWKTQLSKEPLTLRNALSLALDVSAFASVMDQVNPKPIQWTYSKKNKVSLLSEIEDYSTRTDHERLGFSVPLPTFRNLAPIDFVATRAAGIGYIGIVHTSTPYDGLSGRDPIFFASHDIGHWQQLLNRDWEFWQYYFFDSKPSRPFRNQKQWSRWCEHLIERSVLAEKLLTLQKEFRSRPPRGQKEVPLYTEATLFQLLHERAIPLHREILTLLLGNTSQKSSWDPNLESKMTRPFDLGDSLGVRELARKRDKWNRNQVDRAAQVVLEWLKDGQ